MIYVFNKATGDITDVMPETASFEGFNPDLAIGTGTVTVTSEAEEQIVIAENNISEIGDHVDVTSECVLSFKEA